MGNACNSLIPFQLNPNSVPVSVWGLQGTRARIPYTLFVLMKAYLSDLKYALQQCYHKAIIT